MERIRRRIKKGRTRLPLSCQLGAEGRVAQAGEEKVTVSLSLRDPGRDRDSLRSLLDPEWICTSFLFLNKIALFIYLEATLRCSVVLFILQYYLDFCHFTPPEALVIWGPLCLPVAHLLTCADRGVVGYVPSTPACNWVSQWWTQDPDLFSMEFAIVTQRLCFRSAECCEEASERAEMAMCSGRESWGERKLRLGF